METAETPYSKFREPLDSAEEQNQYDPNNCVQNNAVAFTVGAFIAGIGIGIFLATSKREELASLADNIHAGYDNARGQASKAGSYVKDNAPRLKFW